MPGLRTTSVRRTVIVAVSLVTGQAMLGAVIGFVTFDGDDEAPVAPRAADTVAAPPIVVPPSLPAPAASSRPPRHRAAAEVSTSTRRTRSPAPAEAGTTEATSRPATSAPKRPPATPTATVPPTTAPPVPPSPPTLVPPEYNLPPDDTPVPGESCEEEDATGRTGDDRAVRCERDRDGELRWRLL